MGGWLPLGLDNNSDRGISIPGYEFAEGERQSINYAVVTEGYLETLGVDLLEGRTFTRQDDDAGPPVIIVNERFAEHYWPGESALGKIVRTAGDDREVVGVVESGKYRSLGEAPTDFMFLPHRELFSAGMYLIARTHDDPSTVPRRIQDIVRAADPLMPVSDLRTMENHMAFALTPARMGGSILGIFGLLGLTLAAVGVYGVVAYSVAQRARELGIRLALGADRRSVLGLVLGEGMRLTAVGAGLGLLAAAGAARALEGLLYSVNPLDPAVFILVPAVLVGVAALAVYVPARRAARVDPVRALRSE